MTIDGRKKEEKKNKGLGQRYKNRMKKKHFRRQETRNRKQGRIKL